MARKMKEDNLQFSKTAHKEFVSLYDVVIEMFDMSLTIFDETKGQEVDLKKLHELEDKTDVMKEELSTKHYDRLKNGTCHVELSPFYTSLVSELERVADHLTNVGYSFLNPTGDDPEKEA
jgi:phosphate:Na+ symporter